MRSFITVNVPTCWMMSVAANPKPRNKNACLLCAAEDFCYLFLLHQLSTGVSRISRTTSLSMANTTVSEEAKRLAREWAPFDLRANKKILDAWGDPADPPILIREIHAELSKDDPVKGQRFYREFLQPFD